MNEPKTAHSISLRIHTKNKATSGNVACLLIKKQRPGRRLFVCDDENFPDEWRQVSKKELVDLIQKEYEDAKEKFNAFG